MVLLRVNELTWSSMFWFCTCSQYKAADVKITLFTSDGERI